MGSKEIKEEDSIRNKRRTIEYEVRKIADIFFNMYVTSIFPLMYLFFCDELCTRFHSLRTRWRNEVARIIEAGPGISNQKMESERLAHAKLCDLINDVQKAFGSRLTTYLLFVFLDHLARFYFLTYVKPAFLATHPGLQSSFVKDLEPFLFLAHTWTGTYLIAYMSDFLTESSKSVLTDLRNIPLWKLPKECSEQVSFFMTQVQCSNTEMTASGLFVVDKTLLSSIVMSLATYIIVLIQLSPDLGRVFIEN
ncbi:uncharacterized protein LOC126839380 [Adelges cooleyi]|uniref:uncharacterized protein LOC126839380 n=1 Tax=Adelges cooleyi TaxID=133065 RepID=UPI00217FEC3E|nr:uncharacterized protein LOC126839380 [Adelges cooleyi]